MLKIRWSDDRGDPLPWVALACAVAALIGAVLTSGLFKQ